jgi:hypothetical protein
MNYKLLFLGIFLGIILSTLIYCIYNYIYLPNTKWYNSNVGVTKNYLLDGALSIPLTKYNLTNSSSNRFSIELWLFVNPGALPSNNSIQNIFTIKSSTGGSSTSSNIECSPVSTTIDLIQNNEIIRLDLYNDTSLKVSVKSDNTYTKTITPSFPLQKWEQVIISIDQYLLDLYLDGKLMQSIYLNTDNTKKTPDLIKIPNVNNDILIFTKSDIYVSGYSLKTSKIDPNTALTNYKIGKSKVNRNTKVSLALSKNNNVSNNYNLF